jgi:hypothetical protein
VITGHLSTRSANSLCKTISDNRCDDFPHPLALHCVATSLSLSPIRCTLGRTAYLFVRGMPVTNSVGATHRFAAPPCANMI